MWEFLTVSAACGTEPTCFKKRENALLSLNSTKIAYLVRFLSLWNFYTHLLKRLSPHLNSLHPCQWPHCHCCDHSVIAVTGPQGPILSMVKIFFFSENASGGRIKMPCLASVGKLTAQLFLASHSKVNFRWGHLGPQVPTNTLTDFKERARKSIIFHAVTNWYTI